MSRELIRFCEEHRQTVSLAGTMCHWAVLADALYVGAGLGAKYAAVCRIVDRVLVDPLEEVGRAEGVDVIEELRIARDAIQGWAGYASSYFQDKWDLDGDLARIDAVLAVLAEGDS